MFYYQNSIRELFPLIESNYKDSKEHERSDALGFLKHW